MSILSFPPTSRYYGSDVLAITLANGLTVVYLPRRFLPQPESLALLLEHTVAQDDRLDNVTAHYLGDPEQFWRVADANRAMRPEDLTAEVGRRLRITLPAGIPGTPNA
jgi:hypothetical protein